MQEWSVSTKGATGEYWSFMAKVRYLGRKQKRPVMLP